MLLKLIFAGFIVLLQFAAGPAQALENEKMSETRIKLRFNNQEAVIRMTDNPATRQFLVMLPAAAIILSAAKIRMIWRWRLVLF